MSSNGGSLTGEAEVSVLVSPQVEGDKPGHSENDHHFSACPVTGENCNCSHTFDLKGGYSKEQMKPHLCHLYE